MFIHDQETPRDVLVAVRFSNADSAHALDPADPPTLVAEEFVRAEKTRLPVTPAKRRAFHYTEVGLADRFVQQHWESVLYCAEMRAWLIWNGHGSGTKPAELYQSRFYIQSARFVDCTADNNRKAGFLCKNQEAGRLSQ